MKAVEKYESIDTGKGYGKRSGMKRYMASCCFEGALPGKTGCQVSSETFISRRSTHARSHARSFVLTARAVRQALPLPLRMGRIYCFIYVWGGFLDNRVSKASYQMR